jgi:hypothetical protein
MSDEGLIGRTRWYIRLECPECHKEIKIEFRWTPEVVHVWVDGKEVKE